MNATFFQDRDPKPEVRGISNYPHLPVLELDVTDDYLTIHFVNVKALLRFAERVALAARAYAASVQAEHVLADEPAPKAAEPTTATLERQWATEADATN